MRGRSTKRRVLAASLALNVLLLAVLGVMSRHYDVLGDVERRVGWTERDAVDPYDDTLDRFDLHPAESRDVAVIGDSHVAIAEWDELLAIEATASRGIGGDTAAGVRSRVDGLRPLEPQVVVVQVGHNDLMAGRAPEDVARDLEAVVEEIHDLEATALVTTVPPVARSVRGAEDFNRRAEALNAALPHTLARGDEVHIVDLASAVSNTDGYLDDELTFDGRHLAAEGYRRWCDLLLPVLEAQGVKG